MSRRRCVVMGVLALMTGGCDPIVVDPAHADAQELGDDDIVAPNAIAARLSHPGVKEGFDPTGTHPDDLFIQFGNEPQTCADLPSPMPDTSSCEPVDLELETGQVRWLYQAFIPADLLHPGILDLRTLGSGDVEGNYFTDAIQCDSWRLWGAGGTNTEPGTLEITSVDTSSISVSLDIDLTHFLESPDPSGDYTATLCP